MVLCAFCGFNASTGYARKVLNAPLEKFFDAKAQRRKEKPEKRGSALRLCVRNFLAYTYFPRQVVQLIKTTPQSSSLTKALI
jgi:hypothetical protein